MSNITQPVYLGELHKCHQCNVMTNFSASDAYQYMQCARKLYYDKQRGFRVISPELQELFTKGKQEHIRMKLLIQKQYKQYPIEFEKPFTTKINQYTLHGHADAVIHNDQYKLIEIKPTYGLGAYNQTLMYRLLAPECTIHIAEYKQEQYTEYPLKADLTMAKVYFARLVTASKILAPRLPKYPDCFACNNCDVKDQCTKDIDYQWNIQDKRLGIQRLNSVDTLHTFKELADQNYKEIFG